MLQQVLKDMYIDPELLAGLVEQEKQSLFCCMREEQIRRWKVWDQQQVSELLKNHSSKSKRTGKSVQWILDSVGEPLVDIINCNDTEDYICEETEQHENKKYEQKELRLSVKDGSCVDLNNTNGTATKVPRYVDVACNKKNSTSSPSVIINFNEKRGALQELSLNKVPKVAKQVAEWEKRGAVQDEPKPAFNKPPVKLKESEISECEIQQEQIWREQQKKAKEVEIRMRTIARLAREEHRRSLIENNNDKLQSLLIPENRIEACKNKPPSKEAILEWFRTSEVSRKAGLQQDNSVADWFHGFISWQDAENLLCDEKIGTFLVRISDRVWGYTLSYKDSMGVKHHLIEASNKGYKFIGIDKISHNSLDNLINYHKTNALTSNTDQFLKYPCSRSSADLLSLYGKSMS